MKAHQASVISLLASECISSGVRSHAQQVIAKSAAGGARECFVATAGLPISAFNALVKELDADGYSVRHGNVCGDSKEKDLEGITISW